MIVVLFFLVYQDLEKSVDAKDPKRVKVREESRWVIIEKINKLQEWLLLLFYMCSFIPLSSGVTIDSDYCCPSAGIT